MRNRIAPLFRRIKHMCVKLALHRNNRGPQIIYNINVLIWNQLFKISNFVKHELKLLFNRGGGEG